MSQKPGRCYISSDSSFNRDPGSLRTRKVLFFIKLQFQATQTPAEISQALFLQGFFLLRFVSSAFRIRDSIFMPLLI